jgi:hypothetical protein
MLRFHVQVNKAIDPRAFRKEWESKRGTPYSMLRMAGSRITMDFACAEMTRWATEEQGGFRQFFNLAIHGIDPSFAISRLSSEFL